MAEKANIFSPEGGIIASSSILAALYFTHPDIVEREARYLVSRVTRPAAAFGTRVGKTAARAKTVVVGIATHPKLKAYKKRAIKADIYFEIVAGLFDYVLVPISDALGVDLMTTEELGGFAREELILPYADYLVNIWTDMGKAHIRLQQNNTLKNRQEFAKTTAIVGVNMLLIFAAIGGIALAAVYAPIGLPFLGIGLRVAFGDPA